MKQTKRPAWVQTHHYKPPRVNGRRERQQLRRLAATR